jgi:hypothetical protein
MIGVRVFPELLDEIHDLFETHVTTAIRLVIEELAGTAGQPFRV